MFAVCVRCPCVRVQDWTALMSALRYGHVEIAKLLLQEEAINVNVLNGNRTTSEHFFFSGQFVCRYSKQLK